MTVTADIVETGRTTYDIAKYPSMAEEFKAAGVTSIVTVQGHVASPDIKGRFRVGEYISTSYVVKEEGDLIYTRNSVYRKVTGQ